MSEHLSEHLSEQQPEHLFERLSARQSEQLKRHLTLLRQADGAACLRGINHGIEKESLRIDPQGHLAQTPHPQDLGSALTHPSITTDFSEALMEFITPVFQNPRDSLAYLINVHAFAFTRLPREELLWTSSMPCVLPSDDAIPLAQYGSSNIGRLKTLYRKGLGYRYGRSMQTIAGIHYNFSLPDEFWTLYGKLLGNQAPLQEFKTTQYFALIRNFRRYCWLLLYLFGASPALCRSFVKNNPHHGLEPYDAHSLYLPYATSLRMGDLGYTSQAQAALYISYNSLEEYTDGLSKAIKTPYPAYENFRTEDGSPAQLNANLLQIENEFYSTIRPKRIPKRGERIVEALREHGVEYLEVRCLDLNPFLPVGIDEEQMRFLNCFLLFCLLRESPPSTSEQYPELDRNKMLVVKQGRDPALMLTRDGAAVSLRDWAQEILAEVAEIARFLDALDDHSEHSDATRAQLAKITQPELTPSARVLERMRELKTPYFRFAMNQSLANSDYFRAFKLNETTADQFTAMAHTSLTEQKHIEASDTLDFASYLNAANQR
ncbi:MAG: glutamate--cysteine ligase [Pseudomonadales bacterium]|nr:glutamate--cysteine ligase [Pseudomonadales bacterium]